MKGSESMLKRARSILVGTMVLAALPAAAQPAPPPADANATLVTLSEHAERTAAA